MSISFLFDGIHAMPVGRLIVLSAKSNMMSVIFIKFYIQNKKHTSQLIVSVWFGDSNHIKR
jgi:hypothetical protein